MLGQLAEHLPLTSDTSAGDALTLEILHAYAVHWTVAAHATASTSHVVECAATKFRRSARCSSGAAGRVRVEHVEWQAQFNVHILFALRLLVGGTDPMAGAGRVVKATIVLLYIGQARMRYCYVKRYDNASAMRPPELIHFKQI